MRNSLLVAALLLGATFVLGASSTNYPPPPEDCSTKMPQGFLNDLLEGDIYDQEEGENMDLGILVSTQIVKGLDGCGYLENYLEQGSDRLESLAASTSDDFVVAGNGEFFITLTSVEDWNLGIRPIGFEFLSQAQKDAVETATTSGEFDTGPEGIKVYLANDIGTCKRNSYNVNYKPDEQFLTGRLRAPDVFGGRRYRWRETHARRVDASAEPIREAGFDDCCWIKVKGTFRVPVGELPASGVSQIETRVYDCDGNIDRDRDGNVIPRLNPTGPNQQGPTHTINWGGLATYGGHNNRGEEFKSFSGEFILTAPCGGCKLVEFILVGTNYKITAAMDCTVFDCGLGD
jgi:hypothetical protein